VTLASELERTHARIAELETRPRRDPTNSSLPPLQCGFDRAKAKQQTNRSPQTRSTDRKPSEQTCRKGSGPAPTATPEQTKTPPPRRVTVQGAVGT
jgi:hypothetical protein